MKYELRQLSFGETLGQAFNLYFDNFAALFMIALVSNIPIILVIHTTGLYGLGAMSINRGLSFLLLIVLSLAMTIICTALTIEVISKKYLKQHEGIGQYINNVLPLIFPILGLTIVQSLYIFLGFLALIIPGIYIALGLSLAPQAFIVERLKVMEAIKRSFSLTKDKKLEIFGFALILGGINFGIRKLMEGITPMIAQMDATVQTKLIVLFGIAHSLDILVAPISACIFILVYFNYRIEKEGFDLEHLVNQFGSGDSPSAVNPPNPPNTPNPPFSGV